jgi:hypothetical protein
LAGLFHQLTIEDVEKYLDIRGRKGFNVIQVVALTKFDGLNTPNARGDKPLLENDPTGPNEAYFQFMDEVIRMAEAKGIFLALG